MLPSILRRVEEAGHRVFMRPWSANLVIERGPEGPGHWDGMAYLAWMEGDPHDRTQWLGWCVWSWPCATYPSPRALRSPMKPEGAGTLMLGQHKLSHMLGEHNGRAALIQVKGTELPVLRDPDRDGVYEPTKESVGSGYNIHDIRDPEKDLQGCMGLALAHQRQLVAAYRVLVKRDRELNAKVSLTLLAR